MLHGPGVTTLDYSLFKNFPIKERRRRQFRAEFFTLFNHPNFSNPSATFATGAFGSIIQFGLKPSF